MISSKHRAAQTEFEKSLLLLENDIDALGWDQPPRLYGVIGDTDEDMYLELAMVFPEGHPVDIMRQAVQTGRFSDEVRGCVVVTEGWRHPMLSDLKKTDAWDVIMRAARSANVSEEEMEKKAQEATDYANSMMTPSQNPYRVEIRSVIVVMRDGRIMSVHRDRGSDAEIMGGKAGGRVDMAMMAMLTGQWPADL